MNSYDYWRKALAGEKPVMYVDSPELGFYRCGIYSKEPNKARKRVGWSPVAIFPNGEGIVAVVAGREVSDRDRLNELWSYVAGNPISEETYRAVAEKGENWPDSHETVPSIPVANSSMTIEIIEDVPFEPVKLTKSEVASATDGTHVWNDGPLKGQPIGLQELARRKSKMAEFNDGTSRAEIVGAEIDETAKLLANYATIDSDEMASKARSLQQKFLDLRSEATKFYDEANRPLLDQQKRIRAAWFPVRDRADEAANKLRSAMGAWEDTKRKAAQVAAERAGAGQDNAVSNVPPPSAQIKGGNGRAASVTVQCIVTSIDVERVFAQFKDDARLIEFLTDLAQKSIRAGIAVPGAITEQRSVVR